MSNNNTKITKLEEDLKRLKSENSDLKKMQSIFQLLTHNIDEFVWILDKNLKFVFVTPTIKNIIGYTDNEFLNTDLLNISTKQSKNIIRSAFANIQIENAEKDTKKKWLTQQKHKNGNLVWIETTTNQIFDSNGVFDGVIGVSRDVTEQKLAEKELRDNKEQFQSLVDNIPSAAYRCSNIKDRSMKFISTEIESITGYSPDEFMDNKIRSFASIIHIDDQKYVDLVIKEKLNQHKSYSIEYRIVDKWNKVKWVFERGRGNYNENGLLEYVDGVISDITLRKENYQELQRNEQKFRILSNASFDILSLNSKSETIEYTCNVLAKHLNYTSVVALMPDQDMKSIKKYYTTGYKREKTASLIDSYNIKNFDLNVDIVSQYLKGKILIHKMDDQYMHELIPYPESIKKTKKILSNKTLYSIALAENTNLIAIIYFMSNAKSIENETAFIESMANLTSILLQRQHFIESIHRSEEKFRTLFENTSSIIGIITDDKILMANNAFINLMAYSKNEFMKLHPTDLVHPDVKEKLPQLIQKNADSSESNSNFILHLIDKHSNEKWIDTSSTKIDFEELDAILLVGSDITERRKSDLQLTKFSTGIMNSPLSIVITDIEGTIEYVNPYFTETTGYTFEEAIGQNPNILSSGQNPKELYTDMWATINLGNVWKGEFKNKKKNGEFYWEFARIAPIYDQAGNISHFVAVKEDITERKRTIELIEQSEKDLLEINAKKDKFFSIIAHDLRGPFAGLYGLTQLLKKTHKELSEPEIDKYLELLSQSNQNISKLLENLLSWAKTQTGKLEYNPGQIKLNELFNNVISVVNLSASNKEIEIINLVSDEVYVNADNNMINTITRNLISNAIKYTKRNGEIIVNAELVKGNRKDFYKISVQDNGVGIPADKLNKLFKIEDNYSTKGTEKESGTGLGLILCKEFIEIHQGKIWVESVENGGSTFYFTVPKF